MTVDLNRTVQTIESLLQAEEQKPIASRGDIAISELRRKEMQEHIWSLNERIAELQGRINALPDLPNEQIMNWSESVLSMKGLAIVVLDTTGVEEQQHDIIRIHARNQDGIILDQLIKPQRQLHANTTWTGIEYASLLDAPTLAEVWEPIIKPHLSGCFVVSFGLPFVRKMIEGNRAHYGLSRLPFRGEDLMSQAKDYFQIGHYDGLKLADAVARVGKPFPLNPPTADMRATGILALLMAMSQGVTSAPKTEPEIDASTDLGELTVDDHPF